MNPPTRSDITAAIEVLEQIVDDRSVLAVASKSEQTRLLIAAGRAAQPSPWDKRRLARAARKKRRDELKAADNKILNASEIRQKRAAPVFTTPRLGRAPALAGDNLDQKLDPARVHQPRTCYVCKRSFDRIHFFYDALCSACADFNFAKRTPSADLSGKVALITGSRVKIGYQAAIMLLRAGAHVIVTTRFPRDAARRYASEDDFSSWSHRLQIYGLDLRHTPSVESFARHLCTTLDRLDFIINNACQTVRKPAAFYSHLMENERLAHADLPTEQRLVLSSYEQLRGQSPTHTNAPNNLMVSASATIPTASGIANSAELSQLALLAEDSNDSRSSHLFPSGELDADLQQIDRRTINSWRLGLDQISAIELLEVQLVNAVAPFILNSRLRSLIDKQPGNDKHIVNVSAMEGQFYRSYKTDKHPHTNMAKAALNMMTRTSAADYIKSGIHMNSVDTGWITDEDPAEIAARKTKTHGFHPPLDIVDGAARIVDPIFDGHATGNHVWGLFLKDYRATDW